MRVKVFEDGVKEPYYVVSDLLLKEGDKISNGVSQRMTISHAFYEFDSSTPPDQPMEVILVIWIKEDPL